MYQLREKMIHILAPEFCGDANGVFALDQTPVRYTGFGFVCPDSDIRDRLHYHARSMKVCRTTLDNATHEGVYRDPLQLWNISKGYGLS